ncbi:Type 1 glutamine amidotransferase-like domain-containing protein [Virgibacillus doumboii]|uniref:Type 1 glutamine amidotransferase-like domain-containing protein n=1 Tax=Virgibacillus doumboii TaxID=2697503 RepID=UPI0013E0AFA0|nr:Type 1 glutamine amidotransferase-like domain-containing protein [Virgibacillus doumboii]
MINRHLFLFGGSPPFSTYFGKKFADYALNEKGKVAILFIERDGWREYMPKYTHILESNGVNNFLYLPLSPNPDKTILQQLASCTGIIIGGGDTELYRKYIVDTPLGEKIKEMYRRGVPVAGFSAGALISPEHCVIPPVDNAEKKHLFLKGLGLINDCVISVHFSKWNEEENLKAALAKLNAPVGYGIDDCAGLLFESEHLLETDGGKIYTFYN